jgi:DNA primase
MKSDEGYFSFTGSNLRTYEIQEIKRIPLEYFLSRLGHRAVKRSKQRLWYLSPLRIEREPSFCVYYEKNDWYDFGANEGGSIIDLAMKIFDITYKEAMPLLRKFNDQFYETQR